MRTESAPTGGLPFPRALRDHGERPALLTGSTTITYAELADRVDAARGLLGRRRRLVLLAARNDPETVVTYLAALGGGHPVIVVDGENADAVRGLVEVYDPDVVAGWSPRGPKPIASTVDLLERRTRSAHELHPELALLLSTSGSTGSPKLVRLSLDNVEANAASIAEYLAIGAGDRAITSLPLSYSYGLSVLNSHLHRGASVALTDRSVIDPAFWELVDRSGATSFAGVPYTFELLERIGFAAMDLPSLRYVTQAGGRLDPSLVRRFAELGARKGWQLFVMYGQTEATARIAYLPPALAAMRPESIGVPIPGGSLRIDPVPGAPAGIGELVYRGPNVMLGYAEDPRDLAIGRRTDELRTGDLGRRGPDGLFEVVGRVAGFVKIAGLRVDLVGVEQLVARHAGVGSCAVGTDRQLVVFVEPDAPGDLHARIRQRLCLPPSAILVVTLPELPRLANGKVDRVTLQARADRSMPLHATAGGSTAVDATAAVRQLYTTALGGSAVGDAASFASLGGDSLSYVDITLGLEEILGRLPDGWESMSIRELGALGGDPRAGRPSWRQLIGVRSIETGVALRALAILLIVATHIGMIAVPGGAHVLMAVAGFNFARFRLTGAKRTDRLRSQLRATARIALPTMGWVAAVMLLTGEYELRHLLLVNALVRDELWGNLWFMELLVYIGLFMAALVAIPVADRAERRWPFGAALAVLGAGLLFRFGVLDFGIPYTMPVLWLFALGWAASRAERLWQRGLVVAVALLAVPGYFDSLERNAVILGGLVLLVVVPRVRVPGILARSAAVLASASLAIYLVHWEVWPLFDGWYGVPSLVASLTAGIGLWLAAIHAPRAVGRARAWVGVRAFDGTPTLGRPSPGGST